MKPVFKKLFLASVVSSVTLMMAGCSSDDNDSQAPGPGPGIDLEANQVAIFHNRTDGAFDQWGLHLWDIGDKDLADGETDWNAPMMKSGIDETHGAYYIINLNDDRNDNQEFGFIIRDLDGSNPCGDQSYRVAELGEDAYTVEGSCEVSDDPIDLSLLRNAAAHLLGDQLVWNTPDGTTSVELLFAEEGGIHANESNSDLTGDNSRITLEEAGNLKQEGADRYPGFAGMQLWNLPEDSNLKSLVKGQLVVVAKDSDGEALQATRVQFPFALDALFFDGTDLKDTKLGATYEEGNVNIRLWAPTASKVRLQLAENLYDPNARYFVSMEYDEATGVWSYSGSEGYLDRMNYRYEVSVYHRNTDSVEKVLVSDPYSLSVSTNGAFTKIINLDDPELKPAGWDEIEQSRPDDIVVYETHIRDISIFDKDQGNVNPAHNGKYLAFTEQDRASMQHLQNLRNNGLTYLQVLPAFDIATVDENPGKVADLDDPFSKLCKLNEAVGESQFASHCGSNATIAEVFEQVRADDDKNPQALNDYLRMYDSFNWGYDPFHYTAPEGSYASNTSAVSRVVEFREMVKALNDMDIRVAMDVVYNHTNAAGLAEKSVLDKIVPDYYQRLDTTSGSVDQISCCPGTASEQAMMEKLMVDSLEVWARDYKIDAFRFDLMGLHTLENMQKIKKRLEAINPDMYLYGEGWDMQFESQYGYHAATQLNMCNADIGTFNDRQRDAVRGGGPFDGGDQIRENQGFGSDVWGIRNELNTDADEDALLNSKDIVRLGLVGNLKEYRLTNYEGKKVRGWDIDYNGAPAGYTCSPIENVNYVSKHDNQTLWDNNQYKLAEELTADERVQVQVLAQALPILSQGVPFIHMGAEILRSKSMQRDSYDSGDWFNKVDFDIASEEWENNWNKGLPRKDKDGDNWNLIRQITENEKIEVDNTHAELTSALVQEYLKIRSGSPLFRLETLDQVQSVVRFHNTGPDQIPGVIVMELNEGKHRASSNETIVVMINATAEEQSFSIGQDGFDLHPVQKKSASKIIQSASFRDGKFHVPARTVSVFVK